MFFCLDLRSQTLTNVATTVTTLKLRRAGRGPSVSHGLPRLYRLEPDISGPSLSLSLSAEAGVCITGEPTAQLGHGEGAQLS